MDPYTINLLLVTGLKFAGKILESQGGCESYLNSENKQYELLTANAISEVKDSIQKSMMYIVDKIESDKLEELYSRISNLNMLIRMGKKSEAFQYSLTVRESVDYSMNRVKEGKIYWLAPCLIGKSIIIATLELHACDTSQEHEELLSLRRKAKHEILDMLAAKYLSVGKSLPWDDIGKFIEGNSIAEFYENYLAQESMPTRDLKSHAQALESFDGSVPRGRKICRYCSLVSFEQVNICPRCHASNWWK